MAGVNLMKVNYLMAKIFIFAMIFSFISSPVYADDPIAMITDLQGKVELTSSSGKVLTILSELKAGDEVSVASKSRAILVILDSGQEYDITGPAEIKLSLTAPNGVSGNAPKPIGSRLLAKAPVKIQPLKVTQAAVLMRSLEKDKSEIKLLSLNDTKTVENNPSFSWQVVAPELAYKFQLIDEANNSVFETSLNGTTAFLPDSIKLKESSSYKWRVSTKNSNGKLFSNVGSFTVASDELKSQFNSLRPEGGTEFSQRVLYAVWLEQAELKDEARKYWKILSEERSDDPFLKVLAKD